MEELTKKKFTQTRWFIFLVTYLGVALILGLIALDMGDGDPDQIGDFYLWGGVFVFFAGMLFLDRNSPLGWANTSTTAHIDDQRFMRIRNQQKARERVVFPIMAGGIALSATGFLLLKFVFLG